MGTAAPISDSSAQPLAGWKVAVDAGHGGHDRGVCHFRDGVIEKEINLDMARRLREHLEALGAEVILTRSEDTFVSLEERAELANRAGATVFISLHVNRFPSPECFGAQAFYFPESVEGRRLALLVQEELRQVDPENYREALPGRYRVLRLTQMPGTLVEIGFATNPRDRRLLRDESYRQQIVAAITRGLVRFAAGEPAEPRQAVDL